MMKKVVAICLICIFTSNLLFACDNSTKKDNEKISSSKLNAKLNNDNCFEGFIGKPELLLTIELIGKFVDFEGEIPSVEKVSEQIIKNPNFATANCKWKINRKRRIVRLQHISKIELYKSSNAKDHFYDKYHTRTDADKKELKEQYNNEVVDKVDDENISEVANKIIDLNYEYLKIDNVGDAAVWEHKVNNLLVLVGNYQFTVNVNLTKGDNKDLEKAILIAKAIIDKACK